MPKPKPEGASTSWGQLVAAAVRNPAVLRAALRQTLVRALAAAHGQPLRPLLVLLIGPEGPAIELGAVVRRLAYSLRMEQVLAVDAAPYCATLECIVTWRMLPSAPEPECAVVFEGVKPGAASISAETMCILTRGAVAREEISPTVSLLDVLLWLWPTRSGSSKKGATADNAEEGTAP